jgi:hypothetical protein
VIDMAAIGWNTPAFPASEKVEKVLREVLAVNRAMESTLVDVIAAYTPWLASVIPASIGFDNVSRVLHFAPWQAWVYAIVVECLGLATVATSLKFWSWNQEHKRRAPFELALVTGLFYLVIILSVNVLLDDGSALVKLVKALASSLSVAGALIVAMRSQQSRLERQADIDQVKLDQDKLGADQRRREEDSKQIELAKIAAQKDIYALRMAAAAEEKRLAEEHSRNLLHQEKLARIAAKVEETKAKLSQQVSESVTSYEKVPEGEKKFPETFRKWVDWRQVPAEHQRKISGMNLHQVRDEYGTSEKTAGNWIRAAVDKFGGG